MIRFAIEDLHLAIITFKYTSDYQFVIFPASQAIEKLIKAYVIADHILKNSENITGEMHLTHLKYKNPLIAIVSMFGNLGYFFINILIQQGFLGTHAFALQMRTRAFALESRITNILIEEELKKFLKKKYGHDLYKILKDFEANIPFAERLKEEINKIPEAKRIFKKSKINPRYDVMNVTPEKALKVIYATLNIFQLLSDRFTTPFLKALYYPQLEEGYEDYYD